MIDLNKEPLTIDEKDGKVLEEDIDTFIDFVKENNVHEIYQPVYFIELSIPYKRYKELVDSKKHGMSYDRISYDGNFAFFIFKPKLEKVLYEKIGKNKEPKLRQKIAAKVFEGVLNKLTEIQYAGEMTFECKPDQKYNSIFIDWADDKETKEVNLDINKIFNFYN